MQALNLGNPVKAWLLNLKGPVQSLYLFYSNSLEQPKVDNATISHFSTSIQEPYNMVAPQNGYKGDSDW